MPDFVFIDLVLYRNKNKSSLTVYSMDEFMISCLSRSAKTEKLEAIREKYRDISDGLR